MKKGVKMVHINARSLLNKLNDIAINLDFCDIIVITETWLMRSVPTPAITIDRFSVVRHDRDTSRTKKGGGICIYIKNTFTFTILFFFGLISPDIEIIGVKVKIKHIKPCYVFCTYRPPSGNMKNFIEQVKLTLNTFDFTRSELFILGDYTYNSIALTRKLKIKNIESKFNIKQKIDSDTRITNTTSTLLDWIYTTMEYISNSGTIYYNVSDHLLTFLIRKKPRNVLKKITITGRSYVRYDKVAFQQALSQCDWEIFDRTDDPNLMWESFENNIRTVLDM